MERKLLVASASCSNLALRPCLQRGGCHSTQTLKYQPHSSALRTRREVRKRGHVNSKGCEHLRAGRSTGRPGPLGRSPAALRSRTWKHDSGGLCQAPRCRQEASVLHPVPCYVCHLLSQVIVEAVAL